MGAQVDKKSLASCAPFMFSLFKLGMENVSRETI